MLKKHLLSWKFLEEIFPQKILLRDSKTNPYAYLHGDTDFLKNRGRLSAVVGAREPDAISIQTTKKLVNQLVKKEGKIVVSGFARGVDTIALTSALEHKGKIVGVLSESIESFLENNSSLRNDPNILLVSLVGAKDLKSPWDYKVNPLRRNKYIYAFSHEAFVVECKKKKGGTWKGSTEYLKIRESEDIKQYTEIFVSRRKELEVHELLQNKGTGSFEIDNKDSILRHYPKNVRVEQFNLDLEN